ncbi:hypothetical protein [Streptomyces celluloflavus]|uniref:hypothetical protein n=1 Tax=Streptomyces celluloflavus TaxID=58344 RepID=UPI0036B45F06
MSTAPLGVAGPRLAALVERLKEPEAIRSARWAEAFAAVPRQVFVPRRYVTETNGKASRYGGIRPPLHEGERTSYRRSAAASLP